jgi:FixJ family two-component response regulator
MSPIIHVVDDDDSVRVALTRLLRAKGYETRAYKSAGEFLMETRADAPGCVVLDVRMPGPSGLDLHEALVKDENPLPVIFLTGHGDIPTSVRAMRAGAVDFLTKPVRRETLMGAIDSALSRNRTQRLAAEQRRVLRERYERLTARERQVFARVTEGKLNKQIAAELGTSERTIKAHRAQVMDKMSAGSIAELVRDADQLRGSLSTVSG